MGEAVILNLPTALVLYGVALFFFLFERFYKATKGAFTVISAVFVIWGTAYSLLMGAGLWDCAAMLLVFLLLNMNVREKE